MSEVVSHIPVDFTAAFGEFEAVSQGLPEWLSAGRREALARVNAAGLPTRRHEEWKYTNLKPLTETQFDAVATPATTELDEEQFAAHLAIGDVTLVFVDGVLATGLCDLKVLAKGVTIMSLAEAALNDPDLVKRHVDEAAPTPDYYPLADLNRAFLHTGAVIKVGKGVRFVPTLHLVHIGGLANGPVMTSPRYIIALEESAEAKIVESYLHARHPEPVGEGTPYFINAVTSIELAPNSQLTHVRIQDDATTAMHMGLVRATIARDAKLTSYSHVQGAALTRVNIDIALNGPGAAVELDGLYLAGGKRHIDHHTRVDHKVPNAHSDQLYKGVLGDQSRAVFNGKVFVREGASGTQAFQLNKTLMLSSEAEIDTKPELQIDADDVKCTHGAAIGQLAKDELFYLESRGIPPGEARALLANAFADEAVMRLPPGRVVERVRSMVKTIITKTSGSLA